VVAGKIPKYRYKNETVVDTFSYSVFINCPFDLQYYALLKAVIFTIHSLGFIPRCALESANGNETRISKIKRIISECKFGVHDLSRVQISSLPRLNMAFELGLDIGACEYGDKRHQDKSILILDTKKYRYQKFISDISGQDPTIYNGTVSGIIKAVRDWLHQYVHELPVGANDIFNSYQSFRRAETKLRVLKKLDDANTFNFMDFSALVRIWLEEKH
jgi:hypothetical protein